MSVTKEIYIGDAERLFRILDDPRHDVIVTSLLTCSLYHLDSYRRDNIHNVIKGKRIH